MSCRLLSHEKCPPGSFRIEEGGKRFGPSPLINEVAKKLSGYRTANHLPRPGFAECLEDIDLFTCQRLGCSPLWCRDDERPYDQTVAVRPGIGGGCSTCGAVVTP